MTAERAGRGPGAAPDQDQSPGLDPGVTGADLALIAGRRVGPGPDPRAETEMDLPREMTRASQDPKAGKSLAPGQVTGRRRADPSQDLGPRVAQPIETER